MRELVQSNIKALEEGLELLAKITPDAYRQGFKPAFESHIGAHFRHLIEHYQCFFEQLHTRSISYDKRQRDQKLELDMEYARESLLGICDQLNDTDFAAFIENAESSAFRVEDQPLTGSLPTTIERELMFLLSHTVHHYAMIAAMARAVGIAPKKGFGVAIATKSFQACEHATPLSNASKACSH